MGLGFRVVAGRGVVSRRVGALYTPDGPTGAALVAEVPSDSGFIQLTDLRGPTRDQNAKRCPEIARDP